MNIKTDTDDLIALADALEAVLKSHTSCRHTSEYAAVEDQISDLRYIARLQDEEDNSYESRKIQHDIELSEFRGN